MTRQKFARHSIVLGCCLVWSGALAAQDLLFLRGDSNADGSYDISDPITTLLHLFDGRAIACEDAADANDSDGLDIADSIYSLNALFADGPLPPAPGPDACGTDPTPDALGCASFPPCALTFPSW